VQVKMIKSKADEIIGQDPQEPFISNCLPEEQTGKFRILQWN